MSSVALRFVLAVIQALPWTKFFQLFLFLFEDIHRGNLFNVNEILIPERFSCVCFYWAFTFVVLLKVCLKP